MKKSLLLLAGFILLAFTACQSDELVNGGNGGETTVSFSVQLPDDGSGVVTRTTGDGTTVNRCIMEVYLGDNLYKREVSIISSLSAKFNVRLVTSQTYNFVFWADHVASTEGESINVDSHYNTSDLRNISMTGGYNGSSKDDTRDAFYANLDKLVTGAFSESVELTRPFGQLNIKTEDLSTIPANQKTELTPATATLSFKNLYTGFNAATGDLIGEPVAVSYQAAAEVVDAVGSLTVDYLFAPQNVEQHLVNMTLAVNNASGKQITTKDLNNIPVQRNYKTNVTGNLLTVSGDVNVKVVPAFSSPDLSETVVEVASVKDVAKALETNTNVVVTTAPAEATTISLPKYSKEDVAVSITLPATDKDITIDYASEAGGNTNVPKELNIIAPSASKIIIDAKQTTVYLNGTSYSAIEAGTAPNTLVINDGVTVKSLKVTAGNVKIIGTGKVEAISKADDFTDLVYIIASNSNQYPTNLGNGFEVVSSEEVASMKAAFAKGQNYTLTADADITNASMHVSAGQNIILDLNGYTITADNSGVVGGLMIYGTLTLKDSKGNGKIIANRDYSTGYTSTLLYVSGENAKLTMESGNIYAVRSVGQFAVGLYEGADFTMTGGRIEAGYYAVSGNGNYSTQNSIIEITGGELISTTDYAIYLPQSGTTTISGGKVNGAAGGICIKRGTLNISDNANILSLGGGNTGDWGDGTGGLGNSALCIDAEYGDCTVNISGGTFTAVKDAVLVDEKSTNKKNVSVKGGTFSDPSMFGYLAEKADVKVKFIKDYEGPGLGIFNSGTKNGKEATIEVDLNNYTWTLTDDPLFGSTGTENQYFHLEKNASIAFKNGTIQPKASDTGRMLIQNYCDLTLDNVKLIGGKTCKYVVSNNNGSCTISNSTITAAAGQCAFDVFSQKSYPDGVTVTVNKGSVINGRVEFGGNAGEKKGKLVINGGVFNGKLVVTESNYDSVNKNIIINGGEFGNYTGWNEYK